MIIRDSQMEALNSPVEAAYIRSAVNHLTSFDPILAASAGREGLEKTARNGLTAARSHGLASSPALQLYLEMMMSLGCGFDEDPQYAWLRPFLDPRQDMGFVERARFLHFHIDAYLLRAYGPSNEFVREAAETAYEELARLDSPSWAEILPTELLKWLHPQRLDFVDSDAAIQLASEARGAAEDSGLPLPEGANLLLILMFLFGRKVASDPLYPWVEACLADPEPGADRLNHLVGEMKKQLAALLSSMTKEPSR